MSKTRDEDSEGWVIVLVGPGAVIGKLPDEAGVRKEMAGGKTPCASLQPAYILTSQPLFRQAAMGGMELIGFAHVRDSLEQALDLGKRASAPLHTVLSAFYFVSDFDAESRRHIMAAIGDVDRRRRAQDSGIVAVGR
jgi:hypothetical protein